MLQPGVTTRSSGQECYNLVLQLGPRDANATTWSDNYVKWTGMPQPDVTTRSSGRDVTVWCDNKVKGRECYNLM